MGDKMFVILIKNYDKLDEAVGPFENMQLAAEYLTNNRFRSTNGSPLAWDNSGLGVLTPDEARIIKLTEVKNNSREEVRRTCKIDCPNCSMFSI